MQKELQVWDVVEYDDQLVVVTEIDFTGKATITRANGSVTHIKKEFLQHHIKGTIAGMVQNRIESFE